MKGMYDAFNVFINPYPTVPGWEGSGMVIKSGGGMIANSLLNKRVAFVRHLDGNKCELGGTYQQYCIAQAAVPLPDEISYDHGCMFFVNPITAIGLCEQIVVNKSKAAIQTGAAS